MQTEMSVTPIYVGTPDWITAVRTLQASQFELSAIFPNNEGHFPKLIEFDCFLVAARRLAK
jgi:hypothetical protein